MAQKWALWCDFCRMPVSRDGKIVILDAPKRVYDGELCNDCLATADNLPSQPTVN